MLGVISWGVILMLSLLETTLVPFNLVLMWFLARELIGRGRQQWAEAFWVGLVIDLWAGRSWGLTALLLLLALVVEKLWFKVVDRRQGGLVVLMVLLIDVGFSLILGVSIRPLRLMIEVLLFGLFWFLGREWGGRWGREAKTIFVRERQ